MKIAAVCVTYLRPVQLGQMIRCYELQDYPADRRELVILDDAGEHGNQSGPRWRLISTSRRFATLGEKRNAAAALISYDVQAMAVWDDDDLYLPWALRASVAALQQAPWSRPSLVLHPTDDGRLRQHRTGGLFHGAWAYRRDAFWHVGGYPSINNGEDQALAQHLRCASVAAADPIALGFRPFYVYRAHPGSAWHLSAMGDHGYDRLGVLRPATTRLVVHDPPDFDLQHPPIAPGVHRRIF